MPVQTAIQVRRGTASSWTSTNPTLAAGEIGFETDTGKFKIGTGSATWSSLAYTAIPESIFAAKGDILTATGNDAAAVLTAGSNGDTLVADSAATTGLRWSGANQQNPVINGGFDIWQRGTSFAGTVANTNTYGADRWNIYRDNYTFSRQVTNDTTNLPFIQYCIRVQRNNGATTTSSSYLINQFETVNSIPYAGKTVTLSFWARKGANFSPTGSTIRAVIVTGTGTDQRALDGYTGAAVPIDGYPVLTTTWQRFSYSATLASTTTELSIQFIMDGVGTAGANDYYEVTGVQLDIGQTALPFRRSGGTLQGELAACQRYYWRGGGDAANQRFALGIANATTSAYPYITFPVPMRIPPTSVDFSTLGLADTVNAAVAVTAVATADVGRLGTSIQASVASGLTVYRIYQLITNNSTSGYIGFSAEL